MERRSQSDCHSPISVYLYVFFLDMHETSLKNMFFVQVLHWLWHVPLLHSWHWTWLEGGNRAIQVHWVLLGNSRQAKATMVNFSCTSSTWLFILYQLCRRRIIRGTNGEGEPAEALAEIQGGHRCVWPCAQLWKDMPRIPGILITLCSDKMYLIHILSFASRSNMDCFKKNYNIFIMPLHFSNELGISYLQLSTKMDWIPSFFKLTIHCHFFAEYLHQWRETLL